MKIDLQKLHELERLFKDDVITYDAIQSMVNNVLSYNESGLNFSTSNVKLALNTLKEYGIIIEDNEEKSKVQQLNS